ncbi:CPBP family intramembrane glutamic endopeptidase [Staphylococcus gallinarum]|uniref:CPBP family intramembrane glutamic endopeptidase n=1 Tax=Staphylococcus gallinarum TaxID=1293 RepID=UPI001E417025|nr:CPBP family intramembrane glutamic endopeptidase [Staphylococcus gallinarum]MCD8845163.1 CPBP family intramembrane metalloprotease [Staphylococcus gallinarum]
MLKQSNDPIYLKDASFAKRLLFLICAIFIAFCFSFATGLVTSLYEQNVYISIILGIIVMLFYVGFAYFLYRSWQNISVDYDFRKKALFTKSNIRLLGIAIVIMFLVHYLVSFMDKNSTIILEKNWFTIISVLIFQVVLAPIIEEVLCRGIFLSIFFKKEIKILSRFNFNPLIANMILGSITSAYISTILHGISSWPVLITLFTNGLLASFLYYKSKHVASSIVFHFINNAIAWISFIII